MPELRQARGMPTGDHDHLVGLYQEISRSVDTILRSLPGLPLDMRHRALRIGRELLLAQSHVIDKLAYLSDIKPSFDNSFQGPDQRRPQAPTRPATATNHQPITPWLNQHASDPIAGLAGTGSEQARETTDDHRPIETFGSSDGLDVASLTPPGALSDTISQVGGVGAIERERRRQDDQSNLAKLDRVASELQQQFSDHLAHLPSTIVDHDIAIRASSFQSNHQGVHGTFIAILQSGNVNRVASGSISESLRSAAYTSEAATSHVDAEVAALDERHWLEGEVTSPTTRLKTAFGRVMGRAPLALPMIAKLVVAAMAGASIMFWFSAGAPRSAQPAGSASSGTEETRGAPVVAAAPFTKAAAASKEATAKPPTDAPQHAAALQEKFQSRLSPSVAPPLAVADTDTSASERPASENALESPTTSAPVIKPPRNVPSTLSSTDLASPQVDQPRSSAPVQPLSAPTPTAPVMKPPRNIPSMASANLATSQISAVQTGPEPSHAQKAKPTLQKPTHEVAPARQSSQPTSLALEPKPVVDGPKASKTWQTASVAVVAGHFAPVLVTLKDKAAALQIFDDLQKRHAAALANKKAEFRSFVGPDGQTWYHVVAAPPVTEAEASNVCRSLGPEGEALDCAVAAY
jgi:hypothetical protein